MKWFVAVSGNIGSGKATIKTLLSGKLGWRPYYEIVDENPYLPDFYADMPRWSFHLQVFFLSKRFQHHQAITSSPGSVIQDRTIYEDADTFPPASVPPRLDRIRRRARGYEQSIPRDYLAQLNERYEEWTERFSLCPILTVDADRLELNNLAALGAEVP